MDIKFAIVTASDTRDIARSTPQAPRLRTSSGSRAGASCRTSS